MTNIRYAPGHIRACRRSLVDDLLFKLSLVCFYFHFLTGFFSVFHFSVFYFFLADLTRHLHIIACRRSLVDDLLFKLSLVCFYFHFLTGSFSVFQFSVFLLFSCRPHPDTCTLELADAPWLTIYLPLVCFFLPLTIIAT